MYKRQPQHTSLPTLTPQHQSRRRIPRRRLLHQNLPTRPRSCSRQSSTLRNQRRAIPLILYSILTDEPSDRRCSRNDLMRCCRGVVCDGSSCGGGRPVRRCAGVGDVGCARRGGRRTVLTYRDGGVCGFDDNLGLKVAGGCWDGGPLWCWCWRGGTCADDGLS